MKRYKTFEIYPSISCNQKCLHCFNGEEFRKTHKDLTFEDISVSLFEMRKNGYNALSLLGGEPTVYPQIIKVIYLAKKIGYERIMTFSNGLRYSDSLFVSNMKKAGLTDTCLSIHGHMDYLHEAITQVHGSFNKVLKAIENLKKHKIGIMAIITLNGLNYKYFPEMVRFFWKLGTRRFMFFSLKYQGRMNEGGSDKLAVKLSDAFSRIDEVRSFFDRKKIRFPTILHVPPCILPDYVKHLDNYKTKHSVMMLQDGEKYEMNNAHKDLIFKPSCRDCIYFDGCSGFDGEYAKIFGDEEFKPIKKLLRKNSFKYI